MTRPGQRRDALPAPLPKEITMPPSRAAAAAQRRRGPTPPGPPSPRRAATPAPAEQPAHHSRPRVIAGALWAGTARRYALVLRGVGRGVVREPADPRRDREALLAAAVAVVGAAVVWHDSLGPLGHVLAVLTLTVVGAGAYLIPVLAAVVSWRRARHPRPAPPVAHRLRRGWGCAVLGGCGLVFLAGGGGWIGASLATPLAAISPPAAVAVSLLLVVWGVRLITNIPIRQVPQRAAELRRAAGGAPILRTIAGRPDSDNPDTDNPPADPAPPASPPPPAAPRAHAEQPAPPAPAASPPPPTAPTPPGPSANPPRSTASYSPPIERLRPAGDAANAAAAAADAAKATTALNDLFAAFKINAAVADHIRGPAVTRYEVRLQPGERVEKVTRLHKNIAMAVKTPNITVLSPIPGKSAIGIDIPNETRDLVALGDVLRAAAALADQHPLLVGLGKDIEGDFVLASLAKMPHILIAGSTGAGKSTCINTIITSILARATPDQVRMVLIDPKRVELSAYAGVPHLLTPIITDPRRAAAALNWLVREMETRYGDLAAAGVRHVDDFNRDLRAGRLTTPPDATRPWAPYPYIVAIIDELADLMAVASREVEDAICRLAAMARAVGIHLVLATQRPSVDVVTGLIKANVPSRLAFATASLADSRTILDEPGAEKLIGFGDALFKPMGSLNSRRVQGAYVSDEEITAVVDDTRRWGPTAIHDLTSPPMADDREHGQPAPASTDLPADQVRLAAEVAIAAQYASTALIQRKLRVSHAQAGQLLDRLAALGVISQDASQRGRPTLLGPDTSDAELDELLTRQR